MVNLGNTGVHCRNHPLQGGALAQCSRAPCPDPVTFKTSNPHIGRRKGCWSLRVRREQCNQALGAAFAQSGLRCRLGKPLVGILDHGVLSIRREQGHQAPGGAVAQRGLPAVGRALQQRRVGRLQV